MQSRDKDCDDLKIYHYHNNHLGTPQELTNEQGDVIWLSYDYAWGGQYDTFYKTQAIGNHKIAEHELQPIRFQGQMLDIETGLHYNRFRYYDSDVGMFIQRDPIGLLGGVNIFQYADNPIMWIDPLGLAKYQPVFFPPEKVLAEKTIKMQGSRGEDFKEANRLSGFNGKRGRPTQYAHLEKFPDTVWHHATYDPITNEAIMQLVLISDHNATLPHAGSVASFEEAHREKLGSHNYGSQKAKDIASDLNNPCSKA